MEALTEILTPTRTVCQVAGVSKKRLFETIAQTISDDQPDLDAEDVLDQLLARENLGSTGLGQGIAIPHCRVDHCAQPLGSLFTLEEPIPFDAPDDVPVDLLFVLLVPAREHQEHLNILAHIAQRFSQSDFCEQLRACDTSQQLYALAAGD